MNEKPTFPSKLGIDILSEMSVKQVITILIWAQHSQYSPLEFVFLSRHYNDIIIIISQLPMGASLVSTIKLGHRLRFWGQDVNVRRLYPTNISNNIIFNLE